MEAELYALSWNLTSACPRRCVHCYLDAGEESARELSLSEVTGVVQQAAELGTKVIFVSGGEVLLRDDWEQIVSAVAAAGMEPWVNTSGMLLDPSTVDRLISYGVSRLSIGFDSARAAVFDALRGSGAYRSTIEGVRCSVKKGLSVNLDFTLTARNLQDVAGVHAKAIELEVDRLSIKRFVPQGRGQREAGQLELTPRQLRTAHEIWHEQSVRYREQIESLAHDPLYLAYLAEVTDVDDAAALRMDCNAAAGRRGWLGISPNGDVHPCPLMRDVTVGNVRSATLRQLLHARANREIRLRQGMNTRCRECPSFGVCKGGCLCYALKSRGDWRNGDPLCQR